MGPLGLIWKHRWILLVSLLVSAGVAVPFTFDDRATFESRGTVLIPSGDPVSLRITQTSSIEATLTSFGRGQGLEEAVRQQLGEAGDDLLAVSAVQQQSVDFYAVVATARSGATAVAGVDAATQVLIEESNRLADEQVETLRRDVAGRLQPYDEQLAGLTRERADLAARVRTVVGQLEDLRNERARASPEDRPPLQGQIDAVADELQNLQLQRERLDSQIELVESSRSGLSRLVESAVQAQVVRETATQSLGSPSAPSSNLTRRVLEGVGVPLLVGIAVAALALVWLERRRLRPSEVRTPPSGPLRTAVGSPPESEGISEGQRLEALEEEAVRAVAAYREAAERGLSTSRHSGEGA